MQPVVNGVGKVLGSVGHYTMEAGRLAGRGIVGTAKGAAYVGSTAATTSMAVGSVAVHVGKSAVTAVVDPTQTLKNVTGIADLTAVPAALTNATPTEFEVRPGLKVTVDPTIIDNLVAASKLAVVGTAKVAATTAYAVGGVAAGLSAVGLSSVTEGVGAVPYGVFSLTNSAVSLGAKSTYAVTAAAYNGWTTPVMTATQCLDPISQATSQCMALTNGGAVGAAKAVGSVALDGAVATAKVTADTGVMAVKGLGSCIVAQPVFSAAIASGVGLGFWAYRDYANMDPKASMLSKLGTLSLATVKLAAAVALPVVAYSYGCNS